VPQLNWDVPDELVSARFYDTKYIKKKELDIAREEAKQKMNKDETQSTTASQVKEKTGLDCKERGKYYIKYRFWGTFFHFMEENSQCKKKYRRKIST